ncbi:MAG TPA: L-seryl-tRNA(Sec) selenium transferase [Mycobacteriales bacterium]|nr:L-seryl-tRNA(Sec) selenium transferase [Mycobacteriales bacterium]
MADSRRQLPRVDAVLADPRVVAALGRVSRAEAKRTVTETVARARVGDLPAEEVADEVVRLLAGPPIQLRPVLNATGVVLHTNLGRAALSEQAVDALRIAAGHVDLEYDVVTGRRASRGRGTTAALLAAVPAAEAVLVVNNGAAALVLAVTALATGRDVIVSRGELVEIGDGFRLPELICSTGARIREVGTTNRTSVDDYAAAVGDTTGCIVKIHPSNFAVVGYTSTVGVDVLASLGSPLVVDIGSGLLHPDPLLPDEPSASAALEAGAGLVTCSGDKLLGGPQAGLVFGRAELVERLRRHPLARAVRVDKLILAALEATLRGPSSPTRRALLATPEQLRPRAEAIVADLVRHGVAATVEASDGAVGGGGAPGQVLPGVAVALAAEYAEPLRLGDPCLVGRVERSRCLLDLRCIPPESDTALCSAVLAVAAAMG